MIKRGLIACAVVGIATGLAVRTTAAEMNATDKAKAGIQRVADAGRYAYVLFHRGEEGLAAVREVVQKAVAESKDRAEAVEVNVANPGVAETVRNYGVNRAPLPLVLVIAPNGAVTGSIPGPAEPGALTESLVGPKGAACLKAIQDGKVVVICVQNSANRNTEAATKAVTAFKEDKRISGFADSVTIDPADTAEHGFLAKLRVDTKSEAATTLLVTPPGRIVGTYTNDVTVEAMFADLARSMAGATCGGGGCGPTSGGCR